MLSHTVKSYIMYSVIVRHMQLYQKLISHSGVKKMDLRLYSMDVLR